MVRLLLLFLFVPALAWGVPTVAVADLVNATGDTSLDSVGPGVASLLAAKLSRLDQLQVVERARLQEILGELELQQSEHVDPGTARQLGRLIGADYLVLGSLTSARLPALSVSVRVVSVESGEVVMAEDVSGSIGEDGEEFFLILDELAYLLADALELRLAARERIQLSQVDVRGLATVGSWGEALVALDAGETQRAEILLMDVLASEPGFAMADATLQTLQEDISARQGAFAHRDVQRAQEAFAAIEAAVAERAQQPGDGLEDLLAMALQARLHLIHGRFLEYAEIEARRAERTTAAWSDITAAHRYPDAALETAARDLLETVGAGEYRAHFRDLACYPWEIRHQIADILVRIGQRDHAVVLLLDTFQHPGPVQRSRQAPRWPEQQLERWGAWDSVVVLRQQRLRQAELIGDEDAIRAALEELEDAVQETRTVRGRVRTYEATLGELARARNGDRQLLIRELQIASRGPAHLRVAAYEGYTQRVARGFYDGVRDDADFEELSECWLKTMSSHWHEAWFAGLRLQLLLDHQARTPPVDEAAAERQRDALEHFIESSYRP